MVTQIKIYFIVSKHLHNTKLSIILREMFPY